MGLNFRLVRAAALAVTFGALLATGAQGLDRQVTIKNDTGFTLTEFYASSTGTGTWEEDILGSDVLASGSTVSINIDDGTGYCKYDFRAVFDDGDVIERPGVNVCEVATYTYN